MSIINRHMRHLASVGYFPELTMSDPLIPEPDGLTYPEAKAIIEAAQRVVQLWYAPVSGPPKGALIQAMARLRETLRHVTPEPPTCK